MRQILFHIPLSLINSGWADIPVYGYGFMLFLAFIFTNILGKRLCKREGIDGQMIPDLAIWLFVAGIAGGRLVYVVQYWHTFDDRPFWDVVKLWDGGLVLYGALFGALLGFFGYYHFVLSKRGVSAWKMFDIIAPCVALGIAFGRIGCLFTGCCFGNVACEGAPVLHFPLYANTTPAYHLTAPTGEMIKRGYQTPFGFLFNEAFEVEAVEPGSAAQEVLKAKDVIVAVNGKAPLKQADIVPTAAGVLQLTVRRGGDEVTLPPFEPHSIGLNPTQIYETISMCLLLFFLLSYYPFKRHDGELMVFLMIGYAMHRFLNEMLRTDTEAVAFNMTLSQNVSIGIVIAAVILGVVVWRRPGLADERGAPAESAAPSP